LARAFPSRAPTMHRKPGVKRDTRTEEDELEVHGRQARWGGEGAAGATPEPAGAAAGRRPRVGAEAARYGVLRRLAPALKHDMVVNLQAISMMAEVLSARLERGSPAPAEFASSISKLNRLARDAVMNCLKVAAWIEPGEDEGVRVSVGIEECLALLGTNFNFRGFAIVRELTDSDFEVWRVTLRNLLVGSLIALTDAAAGPSEVRVNAEIVDGFAEISVRLTPRQDKFEALPLGPSYRQLEWADVQALAAAELVELVRGPDQIVMRVPRAVATAPLRIAPI
jgi:C4-dicarboxylate-specific signal transduction histidine kinase